MDPKDIDKPTDKIEDKQESGASVRESILSAVKEHAPQDNDRQERDDTKEIKSERDSNEFRDSKQSSDLAEQKSEKEDSKIDAKVEKDRAEDKIEVVEDKAPSILPKELQAAWKDLSPDVKNYVTKTQKELADIKAESGRKAQHYKEIDAAIAPYSQAIQNWGVTPGQTVDRLFKWMDALTGPHKYHYIQQLAYDFGMDLDALYAQKYAQQQQQADPTATADQNIQPQQDYVDPRVAQAIEAMYSEVTQLKNAHVQQKQSAAANHVETWAGAQPDGSYKNKPYFPQVRQIMYSLLASGAVPLVNGNLDLDTAYEHACYSNPEIRQALLAQQAKSEQDKAEEARKKKVAEDQARVTRAKSANQSLKPSSPSGNATSVDANGRVRDNRTGQFKPASVKESLIQSIRELNS